MRGTDTGKVRIRLAAVWATVAVAACGLCSSARAVAHDDDSLARERVPVRRVAFQNGAPSLEGGVGWINTSAPVRLRDLKGKIVLLDFWTYCCINCHHVLPDLAALEKKYANELVVIGVHTAKFDAERSTENIRRKVREYGIKHPVVNDADQVIWNRFGVQSWPTLILITPAGEVFGMAAGEGNFDLLDRVIGKMAKEYRAAGTLNESPIKFPAEVDRPDNTPLLAPGKVLADGPGKRLFVADTTHNRIIVSGLDGKNATAIGSGTPALLDGDFASAAFNRPQGMCLVGDTVYVADTENHAIRAIDLKAKKVETVAGDGGRLENARDVAAGPGKTRRINSPWDIVQLPGTKRLIIAMAGPHQIWEYDLDTGVIGVLAGTSAEDRVDGPFADACFAQPSGLATDGADVFVADSEASSIRRLHFAGGANTVSSIVGLGVFPRRLFTFGDKDGKGANVLLQHCLGVAYADGKIYVADTYNNKIKVVDPAKKIAHTLLGITKPGDSDDPPRLFQPGGLSIAGGVMYIADTNNNKIRAVDLGALASDDAALRKSAVKTIDFAGLKPPSRRAIKPRFPNAAVADLAETKVAAGKALTLAVSVPIAAGYKLSPDEPLPFLLETIDAKDILKSADPAAGVSGVVGHVRGELGVFDGDASSAAARVEPPRAVFKVEVPLARELKAGEKVALRLSASTFICSSKSGLCTVKNHVWNIPIVVDATGATSISVPAK